MQYIFMRERKKPTFIRQKSTLKNKAVTKTRTNPKNHNRI
jgi:hypothetical protein